MSVQHILERLRHSEDRDRCLDELWTALETGRARPTRSKPSFEVVSDLLSLLQLRHVAATRAGLTACGFESAIRHLERQAPGAAATVLPLAMADRHYTLFVLEDTTPSLSCVRVMSSNTAHAGLAQLVGQKIVRLLPGGADGFRIDFSFAHVVSKSAYVVVKTTEESLGSVDKNDEAFALFDDAVVTRVLEGPFETAIECGFHSLIALGESSLRIAESEWRIPDPAIFTSPGGTTAAE